MRATMTKMMMMMMKKEDEDHSDNNNIEDTRGQCRMTF